MGTGEQAHSMGQDTESSTVGTTALFIWHVPLPHINASRAAAEQRAAGLQEALRTTSNTPANASAIALITGQKAPRVKKTSRALAHGEKLDPMVLAALLQRHALSLLDHHATTAESEGGPSALEAINDALQIVDDEMAYLAERTPGTTPDELLPAEIFAELTVTYIRANLEAGHIDTARAAADALAGRIDHLTLDHVRFHALSSLALAHLNDGRPDDALIPAGRARSLARQLGDLTGVWRAERIRAHAASLQRRPHAEESAHREVAALARRLADDLATESEVRTQAALSELESRSVLVRLGLSSGRFPFAEDHAMGILDRVRKARDAGDAPARDLWEYEVDARVARMIVAGMPDSRDRGRHRATIHTHERGRHRAPSHNATIPLTGEERRSAYDIRRKEARAAVASAPETARNKALWWNAYVDDRHAYLLAANGRLKRALRVATRAKARWEELGESELAAQSAADIARLEAKLRRG